MRKKLIEFRKSLGMSQTEFGELFGLDKLAYWRIENGESNGSAEFWIALGAKFGFNFVQLGELMKIY